MSWPRDDESDETASEAESKMAELAEETWSVNSVTHEVAVLRKAVS